MERRIYPPRVYVRNPETDTLVEADYDLYLDAVQNKKPGDRLCHWAGAPGAGREIVEITRIDETGVYGVTIENTIDALRGEGEE